MLKNIRNSKNLAAKLIIGVLLLANLIAFVAGSSHFSLKNDESASETRTEKFSVLKSGWQIMHWSYSLVRYYKGTPAE